MFREKLGGEISCTWNLQRLPFPNTPTCVTFFGMAEQSGLLKKIRGKRLNDHDSWELACTKTAWDYSQTVFPKKLSEWTDNRGHPLARNGATIAPYCLLVVDSKIISGNNVKVTTRESSKLPWSKLGSQKGTVPRNWIRACVSTENLISYILPTTVECVLPIKDGDWDIRAEANQFWKNMTDLYRHNCGKGKSTPKTLQNRVNYNKGLISQLQRVGKYVVYNTAGDNLYAARLPNNNYIVTTKLFYVRCSSDDEAAFLTGILNSNAMLPAFKASRKSDRDFTAHIWREVPIMRYDRSNTLHKNLAALGKRAENTAMSTYRKLGADLTIQKYRLRIKDALIQSGVSDQIDSICAHLFPDHAVIQK